MPPHRAASESRQPWGDIIAHEGRGMFLGSRGCLTDEPFRLVTRRWRMRQDDRVLANHLVDSDGLHTLKPMA